MRDKPATCAALDCPSTDRNSCIVSDTSLVPIPHSTDLCVLSFLTVSNIISKVTENRLKVPFREDVVWCKRETCISITWKCCNTCNLLIILSETNHSRFCVDKQHPFPNLRLIVLFERRTEGEGGGGGGRKISIMYGELIHR